MPRESRNKPIVGPLIGIDVGGTFTDFAVSQDGKLHVFKLPTTPQDQRLAIRNGIDQIDPGSGLPAIVHGTTVATNALLERKGAKTALITTQGFKDVLQIGRQNRPHLYRLSQPPPNSLIPSELRFEVRERVNSLGQVTEQLDEDSLHDLCQVLRDRGVESVCIVFLFSFLNPLHEKVTAKIIRLHLPGIPLSLSCEVLPEYREYERTVTTATNAYLQPPVGGYLANLQAGVSHHTFRVMRSSGGTIGLDTAQKQPVQLLVSGPAAGVAAAQALAQKALATVTPAIITLDMGGTSTDTALCHNGLPMTSESEIGGLPVRIPMVDIHTIGAGGGSIAHVDSAGTLRVGPQSAGADPGPACYGLGGQAPTVTDANLLLGRLPHKPALRGEGLQSLYPEQGQAALERLQERLGADTAQMAAGAVLDIVNASMEKALRIISVERGHNPSDFTLIPFGGAGPLHACALAEALEIQKILIPPTPGVLSALGLLLADVSHSVSRALLQTSEQAAQEPQTVSGLVESLVDQVRAVLATEHLPEITISLQADMRYAGQSYELPVPLAIPVSADILLDTAADFHAVHAQRFGYADLEAQVDIVALRVTGRGKRHSEGMESELRPSDGNPLVSAGELPVWIQAQTPTLTPCYDRGQFRAGHTFLGPAVVFQYDTTTLVLPHWEAKVDSWGNLFLER